MRDFSNIFPLIFRVEDIVGGTLCGVHLMVWARNMGTTEPSKEDLLLKNEVLEREKEREDVSVVAIATIIVTWV